MRESSQVSYLSKRSYSTSFNYHQNVFTPRECNAVTTLELADQNVLVSPAGLVPRRSQDHRHVHLLFRRRTKFREHRLRSSKINRPLVRLKEDCESKYAQNYLGNPSGVLSSASCSNCSRKVATYCRFNKKVTN